METLDAIDAFIYEHGFTLYILFLYFSLFAVGFLLASHTIRSHPPDPRAPRPPHPARCRAQPPVLGLAPPRIGSMPRDK